MSKRMDFDPSTLGFPQPQLGNPFQQEHISPATARKRRLAAPLIPPQQQQNMQTVPMQQVQPQLQQQIQQQPQQQQQPPPPQMMDDQQAMASSSAPMQPPAKKSRTNTPWTAQEEQRLKQMREAGNSWAEIAKTFPSRTEGSVKKHWYKDMHYAEFAEDESAALLNAIKEYETNKWKVIGQKVGKPAKACEQYAKEHFGNNKS